ncbi:MAG: adenylate kinase [Desulfurococcaceae archaeon]
MNTAKLVLIGPPSVGKGTCAKALSEKYGIPHISTGSLFRDEVAKGTDFGKLIKQYVEKGLLVPDELVISFVFKRLLEPDCAKGFILDGFPRTLNQAKALDEFTKIDLVILLDAPLDVILERALGRLICPRCGAIYHTRWKPPRCSNICDNCGSVLEKREDDNPKVVKQRYEIYLNTFQPIINYYKDRKILVAIDASRSTSDVIKEIERILEEKHLL